ncbi:MAG: hypothetical protein B6229_07120 [Spirochaetaceae bacterium 4572_7]|nr:MAG: hypothetical protein B6229_07120 [Spirochaetaceae bacterium 4572_7]
MKIHILGGGPGQISAIKRAKDRGFKVIVSDLDPNAPGIELSDYKSYASTFDEKAVLNDASKFGSSYLMTTGTDQPVLTAAIVSKKLNLPYFLTPEQALIVTNKKVMKNSMRDVNIPTMPFVILKEDFTDDDIKDLNFPLVIKPLDSQGQRGVLKVDTPTQIRKNFKTVLSFSRENEILAEEYYPSDEITVSGWVDNGETKILMVTDRVTIDNGPHLGVCISHRYPSIFQNRMNEIKTVVNNLTKMIGLKNGPIYFQILGGEKGFIVNEIACRLGGAYEDEFIPLMTGVPIMDIMIDMSSGIEYNLPKQEEIDATIAGKYLSLQMFFSRPGTLCKISGMDKILSIKGILNGNFLLKEDTLIESRENSTQRAGYFIIIGESRTEINQKILEAYDNLILENESGLSMLQTYKRMLFQIEKN